MTVLEPSANLLPGTTNPAPGDADQEQQQAEPFTSRSGSDTWQQQSTQNPVAGQQQQQLDTFIGTATAAMRIPLKVSPYFV